MSVGLVHSESGEIVEGQENYTPQRVEMSPPKAFYGERQTNVFPNNVDGCAELIFRPCFY